MGVKISYQELGALGTQLGAIIDEFDHAGARRQDLEDAVARPYGNGQLKDAAHEFESRWDDRRQRLTESCRTVAEHLAAVIEGFQSFDEDAAKETSGP